MVGNIIYRMITNIHPECNLITIETRKIAGDINCYIYTIDGSNGFILTQEDIDNYKLQLFVLEKL